MGFYVILSRGSSDPVSDVSADFAEFAARSASPEPQAHSRHRRPYFAFRVSNQPGDELSLRINCELQCLDRAVVSLRRGHRYPAARKALSGRRIQSQPGSVAHRKTFARDAFSIVVEMPVRFANRRSISSHRTRVSQATDYWPSFSKDILVSDQKKKRRSRQAPSSGSCRAASSELIRRINRRG